MKKCFMLIQACLCLAFYGVTTAQSNTLYVDNAVATSGDGTSWSTAMSSLADALVQAHGNLDIDTILVAKGTYKPQFKTPGMTSNFYVLDRDATFYIKRDGLAIIGGYPNGGGNRNWKANPTILSGDIGTVNNTTDNAFHVLLTKGESEENPLDSTLYIDGFIIERGYGYFAQNHNVTLDGVKVDRHDGGGMHNLYSSPKLVNLLFRNNVVGASSSSYLTGRGGGIYNNYSSPTLVDVEFRSNSAYYLGGGMSNDNSSPLIINTTFVENKAPKGRAGAIYNSSSLPTIINTLMYGNTAKESGAAMYNANRSTVSIINNTIANNTTTDSGYAIDNYFNCKLSVTNSIILGNISKSFLTLPGSNGGSSPVFSHSMIQKLPFGSNGNIEPKAVIEVFVTTNTNAPNYRLTRGSDCIGAGINDSIPAYLTTDIEGNDRIRNGTVDMGAYVYEPCYYDNVIYVDSFRTGSTNLQDGYTWFRALPTLSEALKLAEECPNINTILVAKGTYYPTGSIVASPTEAQRDSTFLITRGIKLLGGYPTNGYTARNPAKYPTILSGNITNANTENSNHIVVVAGIEEETDSLVIDGFTFTNGQAESANANPKILNGVAVSRTNGGALYISGNDSASSSLFAIRNNNFINNSASNNGGAVYLENGNLQMTNNFFVGNEALNNGGALYNNEIANLKLQNLVFAQNTATAGAAIYNHQAADVAMNNTVFTKNTGANGAAIYNVNSTDINVNNSIIWGNESGIYNNASTPSIQYSLVEGYTYGVDDLNNLANTADPNFLDTANLIGDDGIWGTNDDGLQLQFCSPALNSGNNSSVSSSVTKDIAGRARIIGGTIDLGAYEKQSDVTNFENNATLPAETPGTNTLFSVCEEEDWAWYANAANPDSLSFAVKWGNNNDVAKNAAQVLYSVATNNQLVSNDTSSSTATMKRYWNVDLNGTTLTEPVSVRFFFNPADTVAMRNALLAENNGIPNGLIWFKTKEGLFNPALVNYDDTTIDADKFTTLTATYGIANGVHYVEFNNLTSFSGGTAGMTVGTESPLSLAVLNFSAEGVNQKTKLNWKTADEKQTHSYEIERSANGTTWNFVSSVLAKGKVDNNYQAWDYSPVNGTNLYRLKIKNNDGTYQYSQVARVYFADLNSLDINIYPNPNQGTFTIVANGINQQVPMNIVDVLGRVVYTGNINSGSNLVSVKGLTKGVYIVSVQINGEAQNSRLVVE